MLLQAALVTDNHGVGVTNTNVMSSVRVVWLCCIECVNTQALGSIAHSDVLHYQYMSDDLHHVNHMMSDTRHGWIHLESIPSRSLHLVDRGELVQSQITCSVMHDTHMPIAQGAYRDIIVCMLITMRVMCNTCNTTFAT